MPYRPLTRKLTDFQQLLARLEKNRHAYNAVSFAQLRRILERRIAALTAELHGKPLRPPLRPNDGRRAA